MKTNLKTKVQALGDPTRMAIFECLEGGPLPVGEIARGLPVTRSAVSQHLKILKIAGLVTSQRAANRQLYRIDAAGVAELRDYFDRFWHESLQAFKRAAESSLKEKSR
ncbi:MAG TPA: metalloregulator ArsR/SmtB family transcription factor [Rhodanobacteraceae bacterium]|nr:metalloregulator ArsR/SmtB family transcription factor [Rhodanobacteraceae bacterium]